MSRPLPNLKRKFWLIKFAPFRASWTEIVRAGTFTLRGVRSPASRKHLAAMRPGDEVLFYHSQKELAVVGLLQVTRKAYPDPTSADLQWLTCDFAPQQTLPRPVSRDILKADLRFAALPLLRQPRLSVMPVTELEFQAIKALSEQ